MTIELTPLRIAVITTPDALDDQWIARLADEPFVAGVEQLGVLSASIDRIQSGQIDLVILDREDAEIEAAVRQIASISQIPVIVIAADMTTAAMRRLFHMGARDVLPRPVPYNDLLVSVQSIVEAETARRQTMAVQVQSATTHKRGRLLVVMSPKGGVGTTTIATNLAIALRQMTASPVVLSDFALQFGDVGVHLNIWSRYTMQDLLQNANEINDSMIDQVLQEHKTGIKVLLAPNEPEVASEVSSEQIETIIDKLLDRYAYVVCDTWSFVDDVTLTLIRRADEVLVVATPEVPTLKNAKHFLEFSRRHELINGRVTLVLNRFPSVEGISLQDVQTHLGYPVGANIPSEGQSVTYSINQGVPLLMTNQKSWASQSIRKLAAYITGDQVSPLSLTPDDRRKGKEVDAKDQSERRGFLRFVRRAS